MKKIALYHAVMAFLCHGASAACFGLGVGMAVIHSLHRWDIGTFLLVASIVLDRKGDYHYCESRKIEVLLTRIPDAHP